MPYAKFHVIGDTGAWIRLRLQEEIHASGVEGTVMEAAENILAIVVEGEEKNIQKLYLNLKESTPGDYQFTELETSREKPSRKNEPDLAKSIGEMLELLREIEKNTRRMNQKIDAALAAGPGETEGAWDSEDFETGFEKPDAQEQEEQEEAAESGFANLFGD